MGPIVWDSILSLGSTPEDFAQHTPKVPARRTAAPPLENNGDEHILMSMDLDIEWWEPGGRGHLKVMACIG